MVWVGGWVSSINWSNPYLRLCINPPLKCIPFFLLQGKLRNTELVKFSSDIRSIDIYYQVRFKTTAAVLTLDNL